MKTKFTTVFIGLIVAAFTCNVSALIIYTPYGSAIYASQPSEMSAQEIAAITAECAALYPNATVLANASARYNCHGYAWCIKEGGPTCWISQNPDLSRYWTDGSYAQTTEASAEKIFYYNGDHSAVKSSVVAGKYESKWGQAPLMRHDPTYGPSIYNMQYRRYYKKEPVISGPIDYPNAQYATYSCSFSLPGTWSVTYPLSIYSGQGTASIVVSCPPFPGTSSATVNLTISSTGQTLHKTVFFMPDTLYAASARIYPNPVNNILNIELLQQEPVQNTLAINMANEYTIQLYNQSGLLQKTVKVKNGVDKASLDVSNLANGIYYLHIYLVSNSTPEIRKIIIRH
jgi:hypothetical protein